MQMTESGHGRVWHTDGRLALSGKAICNCLVCGEAPAELKFRARTNRVPQSYRITEEKLATCWDIWRCERCGFVFSDWKLTDEQLSHLYASMEDALYEREEETRRLTFRRGLSLIESIAGAPAGRKLLDIGCATGGFLHEAKGLGWNVYGIDLSAWAVGRAHEKGLAHVHEGTAYTFPEPPESFDVVTMLDYIEHDPDPALLIDRTRELLRPGGCVYITTPDIGGMVAKILGSKWWGVNPLHLHYFSRKTLQKLLEQHGFEVLVSRSYTRVFTVGYWASRLEHFHPALARASVGTFRALRLADRQLKLNLGDMMEVVARKR